MEGFRISSSSATGMVAPAEDEVIEVRDSWFNHVSSPASISRNSGYF